MIALCVFPFNITSHLKLVSYHWRWTSLLAVVEESSTTWLLHNKNANNLIIWNWTNKLDGITHLISLIMIEKQRMESNTVHWGTPLFMGLSSVNVFPLQSFLRLVPIESEASWLEQVVSIGHGWRQKVALISLTVWRYKEIAILVMRQMACSTLQDSNVQQYDNWCK